MQKTVGGAVTHYFVDTTNPTGYAQVLAEETASNFGFTNYTWGLELVSRDFSSGHDAFGNLIHSTGATPNNYLFAGEQFDPNLNLYYNRARYLSTNTGRFWSVDTFEGDPQSPSSLHKYLYASADPVNRTDPSGRQDEVDVLGAITVASTITA